jgi:hypothetical protein
MTMAEKSMPGIVMSDAVVFLFAGGFGDFEGYGFDLFIQCFEQG